MKQPVVNRNAPQFLNVVVVQRSVHQDQGGLTTSTALLCDALVENGVRASLVSRMEKEGIEVMVLPQRPEVGMTFAGLRKKPTPMVFFDRHFLQAIEKSCRENAARVIHTRDLWTPEVYLAGRMARKINLPLVMSIDGTLTPWSLKHKAWKKKIGWLLYQKRGLMEANLLHATSRSEAGDLRRLGLSNPIAVIPPPVSLPDGENLAKPPSRRNRRTVLYLSRIHHKKGLIHLIRAWNEIRPHGWRVVIAGQDDCGYRSELEREVRHLHLDGDFIFRGFVSPGEKETLYREADLFVLPTYSENFGLVVPEALSRGVPVITTRGTPWEELRTHRCGWWINTGTEPLIGALRQALALPTEERRMMGERGRKLVREEYSLARVGKRFRDLYHWLIARGEPPAFIIFD